MLAFVRRLGSWLSSFNRRVLCDRTHGVLYVHCSQCNGAHSCFVFGSSRDCVYANAIAALLITFTMFIYYERTDVRTVCVQMVICAHSLASRNTLCNTEFDETKYLLKSKAHENHFGRNYKLQQICACKFGWGIANRTHARSLSNGTKLTKTPLNHSISQKTGAFFVLLRLIGLARRN